VPSIVGEGDALNGYAIGRDHRSAHAGRGARHVIGDEDAVRSVVMDYVEGGSKATRAG
jgi:hypothetical protein